MHLNTAADVTPFDTTPTATATATAIASESLATDSLVPRSHTLRDTLRQASAATPPRRERSRTARLLLAARELVDVLEPKYPHPHPSWDTHPPAVSVQAQSLLSSAAIELAYVKSLSRLRYLLHRKKVQRQLDLKTREIRTLLAQVLASAPTAAVSDAIAMAKHPLSPLSRQVSGSGGGDVGHPADNRPLLRNTSRLENTRPLQDADKALSHVIALSNDTQFLESLRTDETCPVYALLDILEVVNAACPAENPRKRKSPFHLSLAVEPTCPAEFYPDHLDQEEMDKRVQQIVNTPTPASTGPKSPPLAALHPNPPGSSVFDDPEPTVSGAAAGPPTANPHRISGIFDAVIHQAERAATPDTPAPPVPAAAWPRVGPNGQPLPSLSRFTTVAKIMESNFGPNALPAGGLASPVRTGSADVTKPRSRTVNDSGTFVASSSPGDTNADTPHGSLARRPQSVPPKPTLFSGAPLTVDPDEVDAPLPGSVASKPVGRSPTGSGVFAEPRYPSLERNVMVLPSPTRATALPDQGSHFDSCPVCHLVTDYSYTKFIQLSILYHENNDLEQSYHCLQHAVDVANAEECPMPTPYFLTALYLRHGWGVETHPADSFRLLLLSLEYAIKHVLAMQLSAGDRPLSPESDPASGPFSLSPTGPAKKRTPVQEYMATYRDAPLPYDPWAIHGSPARMGVAMILYECGVSLRYGWGTKGHSRLAKALVTLAANLGDVQACVEVGTRLARRAHRVSPVAAIKGERKGKARVTREAAVRYLRYAALGGVRDALVGWALNEKYDAVVAVAHK